jgi:hypothetical protein
MDRTLRNFLQQADDVHEYLEKYCVALSADQIENKVLELQASIKVLQTVAYQLANVSNIAKRVVIQKRRHKKATLSEVVQNSDKPGKFIDPYPTENDVGTLRSLNPIESKEIAKGIKIPVRIVETAQEIPVSHLYYINELKQFAINVEGITIRGNLGNLVDYQEENSAVCEYGINCNSFKSANVCKYYHDPLDYKHHGLPIPEHPRNFTVGSWLYSKKKSPRTYFTRHVGSKHRLIYDLNTLKRVQYREEIFNREGQLIHDLMIYMILNARGMLERYPHWSRVPIQK